MTDYRERAREFQQYMLASHGIDICEGCTDILTALLDEVAREALHRWLCGDAREQAIRAGAEAMYDKTITMPKPSYIHSDDGRRILFVNQDDVLHAANVRQNTIDAIVAQVMEQR